MNPKLRPQDDELLSAYLDDELDDKDRTRVEKRLESDVEYRKIHEELKSLRESLQTLPYHKLEKDFHTRVLHAISQQQKNQTISPSTQQTDQQTKTPTTTSGRMVRGNWRFASLGLIALAAALLVMALGPWQDNYKWGVVQAPSSGEANRDAASDTTDSVSSQGTVMDNLAVTARNAEGKQLEASESLREEGLGQALDELELSDSSDESGNSKPTGKGSGVGNANAESYGRNSRALDADSGEPQSPLGDDNLGRTLRQSQNLRSVQEEFQAPAPTAPTPFFIEPVQAKEQDQSARQLVLIVRFTGAKKRDLAERELNATTSRPDFDVFQKHFTKLEISDKELDELGKRSERELAKLRTQLGGRRYGLSLQQIADSRVESGSEFNGDANTKPSRYFTEGAPDEIAALLNDLQADPNLQLTLARESRKADLPRMFAGKDVRSLARDDNNRGFGTRPEGQVRTSGRSSLADSISIESDATKAFSDLGDATVISDGVVVSKAVKAVPRAASRGVISGGIHAPSAVAEKPPTEPTPSRATAGQGIEDAPVATQPSRFAEPNSSVLRRKLAPRGASVPSEDTAEGVDSKLAEVIKSQSGERIRVWFVIQPAPVAASDVSPPTIRAVPPP